MSVNVLLVDDEDDNQALLVELLRFHGFVVTTASERRVALAALRSLTVGDVPCAMLLDLDMRALDARALLASLHSEGVPVPVVALVAEASAEVSTASVTLRKLSELGRLPAVLRSHAGPRTEAARGSRR